MLQDPKIKSSKIFRWNKAQPYVLGKQRLSLLLAQLHTPSLERWVTQLGFYHPLWLSTPSFNPWLPSRAYVVTLLLQILRWSTAPFFLPSLLELHISLLEKNDSRSSPASSEKQSGAYLILSLLKYEHLVSACIFSFVVFVIQKNCVKRISCRSTEE